MNLWEDYSKGSRVSQRADELAVVAKMFPAGSPPPTLDEESVQVLLRSRMRDFVDEYLDTDGWTYALPCPCCHHFADKAYADLIGGSVAQRFPGGKVAVYRTSLTLQQGRHKLLACHVIDDATGADAIDYLQCEGGKWVTLESLGDKTVDQEEG